MNNLFNILGGGNISQTLGGLGQMQNLIQQFEQFRKAFNGDPRQQVQEMLNSGQLTQAQFDQVAKLATEFQKMIEK